MKHQSCTFYLVRHGETDWNRQGRVQGHTDIDLNPDGLIQAQKRAEIFKDIAFAAAISSDLKRAMQTATILSEGRSLELQVSAVLREQSWGPWEGHFFDSLREKFGEDFNSYTGKPEHKVPNVESHLQIVNRVEPFLHQTAHSYLGKNLLVVTHGGVLKGICNYLNSQDFKEMHFENLGFIKVQSDGKKLTFLEAVGTKTNSGSYAKN